MEERRLYTLGAIGAAIAVAVAVAGRSPKAAGAMRVPTDPNEVVERLPRRGVDPKSREADALRAALARDPNDLRAAARLARIDIQLARERSDPRYLGRAQAVLAPWWNDAAPPVVLVLRATIEQSLHDFDAALRHLDLALAAAPDDAQAWLTRAVVLTVRARYDEARASCARVAPLAGDLAFAVCETQIESLTGKARAAYDRLSATIARQGRVSPDEEEWAVSSLGEYAVRLGDLVAAERHFRRSLELAPDDAYVRGALADLLTDLGRPQEAVELVRGHEPDDALLLRLAIAERHAKLASANEHIAALEARFDASRARGDVVHRREEARFWLELHDDAARALPLAQANWDVQKEPWDARIFLAAAVSAHGTATPVLEHLDRTHLEDPTIARLAKEVRH